MDIPRASGRSVTARGRRQLSLPTTLAGAELCGLIAFVGLRIVDLIQLAVAAPGGLGRSTRPTLDASLMVLFVVESIVIVTLVVRARRYLSLRLAVLDTTLALVILSLEPVFTTPTDRVGTWTAWGFAVSVGTALGIGIGFPRAWQTWTAATALATAYLVVSLPDPSAGAHSSAWSNAVAYFGFALIARGLAGYLRRMGRDADEARAAARQLGRKQELEQHQRLLHDQATVLHLVSGHTAEDPLTAALREQAALGARQIRAFLGRVVEQSAASDVAGEDCLLTTVVREVAASFVDLPIDLLLDLAGEVVLDEPTARAVRGALSAALHNVRVHADARQVVVHADSDPATGTWELAITDNGRGFDPAGVTAGFGLREQITRSLAEQSVTARVESAPGRGTALTISGTLAAARQRLA